MNIGAVSGSGGSIIILFDNMLIFTILKHGNCMSNYQNCHHYQKSPLLSKLDHDMRLFFRDPRNFAGVRRRIPGLPLMSEIFSTKSLRRESV